MLKILQNTVETIKGFFPEVCAGCEQNLSHENLLCIKCMYNLPTTDQFSIKDNRFTKHFVGRINLIHGAAFIEFYKDGIIQELLHKLKYKNKYYVGEFLGRMAAKRLVDSSLFGHIDLIVPVPLHAKKRRRRGYNQCEAFASGLSEVSGIPTDFDLLLKTTHTQSQTAKSRTDRLKNVESSFTIKNDKNPSGKHILLVDDVITTGATLEACALAILDKSPFTNISMLTIAIAMD